MTKMKPNDELIDISPMLLYKLTRVAMNSPKILHGDSKMSNAALVFMSRRLVLLPPFRPRPPHLPPPSSSSPTRRRKFCLPA